MNFNIFPDLKLRDYLFYKTTSYFFIKNACILQVEVEHNEDGDLTFETNEKPLWFAKVIKVNWAILFRQI